MLNEEQKAKIKEAFREGRLRVKSVSPAGEVQWKRVLDVSRAEVPWETIYRGHTEYGPFTLTGGHRVFTSPTSKVEMEKVGESGKALAVFDGERAGEVRVLSVKAIGSRKFMFDLTAEDWHNFVLHESRVVVSNSPDRNYHFRPPEHEARINRYNRVFGQVWEDVELLQYLRWALDWWNMYPPETEKLWNLDLLWQNKPTWRTAILWGAAVHALFALAVNWVHEEFSLSGDTTVRVVLSDGEEVDVPIAELYETIHGD